MKEVSWCELCGVRGARVHCPADGARLCWGCDARVHAANFLVARHDRALLCRRCGGTTAWHASGLRLAPASHTLCLPCLGIPKTQLAEEEDEEEGDYDGLEEDDGVEEEEDEGEEQVVPWAAAEQPEASSSSGMEGRVGAGRMLKRKRENADLGSQLFMSGLPRDFRSKNDQDFAAQDELAGSSSQLSHFASPPPLEPQAQLKAFGEDEATSPSISIWPAKCLRKDAWLRGSAQAQSPSSHVTPRLGSRSCRDTQAVDLSSSNSLNRQI